MKKQSEFSEKECNLQNSSFTQEFTNNELPLDVIFNTLELKVDVTDLYTDGTILHIVLDLNEKNKKILTPIVKDFDAYNNLIDLQFGSEKKDDQTDLISIIDYSGDILGDQIIYDWNSEAFYYKHQD